LGSESGSGVPERRIGVERGGEEVVLGVIGLEMSGGLMRKIWHKKVVLAWNFGKYFP
jgi:hypothetical protein